MTERQSEFEPSVSRRAVLYGVGAGAVGLSAVPTVSAGQQSPTWTDTFEDGSEGHPDGWSVDPNRPPPGTFRIDCTESAQGSCSMYVAGDGRGADSAVGNVGALPPARYTRLDFHLKTTGRARDGTQIRLADGDEVDAEGGFAQYGLENEELSGDCMDGPVPAAHETWHRFRFEFTWDGPDVGWDLLFDGDTVASCPPSESRDVDAITGVVFRQASFRRGEHYVDDVRFFGGDSGGTGAQAETGREFVTVRTRDIYDNPVSDVRVSLYHVPPAEQFDTIDPASIGLVASGTTGSGGRLAFSGGSDGPGEQTDGDALLRDQLAQLRSRFDGRVLAHAVAPQAVGGEGRRWFGTLALPVADWFGDGQTTLTLNEEVLDGPRILTEEMWGAISVWRQVDGQNPRRQVVRIGVSRQDILRAGQVGEGVLRNASPVVMNAATVLVVPESVTVDYPLSGLEWIPESGERKPEDALSVGAREDIPELPLQALVDGRGYTVYEPVLDEYAEQRTEDVVGFIPYLGPAVALQSIVYDAFGVGDDIRRELGAGHDLGPNSHDFVSKVIDDSTWGVVQETHMTFPTDETYEFGTQSTYAVPSPGGELDSPVANVRLDTSFSIAGRPPELGR